MSRERSFVHPQAKQFGAWIAALSDGPLAEATVRSYATDVARFLKAFRSTPLRKLTSDDVANFIASNLTKAGRRRMLSALSEFWAFALESEWVSSDIMRDLKYRRSANATESQMSLLDLLKTQGVPERDARQLRWSDFVDPLVAREKRVLRIGAESVLVTPYVWNRLDIEFRALVASHGLSALLKKRIA